jgi:hypothetical protein
MCHVLFLVKWFLLEHISQFSISYPHSPASWGCWLTDATSLALSRKFCNGCNSLLPRQNWPVFVYFHRLWGEPPLLWHSHTYYFIWMKRNVCHLWWLNWTACFSLCKSLLATFSLLCRITPFWSFPGFLEMLWNAFKPSSAFVWGNHVVNVEI